MIKKRSDDLELLALKPNEQKVILCISKMAKTLGMISRHTQIPYSTLQYLIKRLEKKSYVCSIVDGKRTYWHSNVGKILHFIYNNQKMKK